MKKNVKELISSILFASYCFSCSLATLPNLLPRTNQCWSKNTKIYVFLKFLKELKKLGYSSDFMSKFIPNQSNLTVFLSNKTETEKEKIARGFDNFIDRLREPFKSRLEGLRGLVFNQFILQIDEQLQQIDYTKIDLNYLKEIYMSELSDRNISLKLNETLDLDKEIYQLREDVYKLLHQLPPKTLKNLLTEAQEAWIAGRLECFDALVGNTRCEITASMIADHSDKNIVVSDNLNDPVTLFIFVAFLLTKYKVSNPNSNGTLHGCSEWVDLTTISKSGNFSKKLCNHAQRLLAAQSIEYLQGKAHILGFSDLSSILQKFIRLDEWKRLLVPFYPSIKTFVNYTISRNRPLILHYKYFCNTPECKHGYHMLTYFVAVGSRGKLKYILPSQEDLAKTAIIYDVWSCSPELFDFKKHTINFSNRNTELVGHCEDSIKRLGEIISASIKKILLVDAAQHSQWAGQACSDEDAERRSLCQKLLLLAPKMSPELYKANRCAQKYGISKNNPTFFFIDHVFAGQVKHYIGDKELSNMIRDSNLIAIVSIVNDAEKHCANVLQQILITEG